MVAKQWRWMVFTGPLGASVAVRLLSLLPIHLNCWDVSLLIWGIHITLQLLRESIFRAECRQIHSSEKISFSGCLIYCINRLTRPHRPHGICLSGHGRLFVVDTVNERTGRWVALWAWPEQHCFAICDSGAALKSRGRQLDACFLSGGYEKCDVFCVLVESGESTSSKERQKE